MEAEEPTAGATAEARRKAPPCGNPRCESPGDNVRLQFIPDGFAGEVRPGAVCFHLKRADCRRHFLGGEPGKPGRPAKRGSESTRIPVGKALAVEPCPPIIDSIDEVWGYRCATAPASCVCTVSPVLPRAGCATLPGWALRTGLSLCKAP